MTVKEMEEKFLARGRTEQLIYDVRHKGESFSVYSSEEEMRQWLRQEKGHLLIFAVHDPVVEELRKKLETIKMYSW